jgi:hypothetical protein
MSDKPDVSDITLENFNELWPLPSVEECEANSRIIRQTPYGLQDGNGVDVTRRGAARPAPHSSGRRQICPSSSMINHLLWAATSPSTRPTQTATFG